MATSSMWPPVATKLLPDTPVHLADAPDLVARNAAGLLDVSPNTLRWFKTCVASLQHFYAVETVDQVTAGMLYDWLHGLDILPVTANSYLRGLQTIYSRLVQRGVVAENPAVYVRPLPEPRPRPKAISDATYHKMLEVSDGRDKAILSMLYATGCRIGGLVSMRLSSLEIIRRDQLAIQVVEKGEKVRFVYAGGDEARRIMAWVDERPKTGFDALFLSVHRRPLALSSVHSVLRKARIAAGIPDGEPCNAHSFRHAFAIRMLDNGHDIATVAAWLGHSDPALTAKFYAVRREDELRRLYFRGRN